MRKDKKSGAGPAKGGKGKGGKGRGREEVEEDKVEDKDEDVLTVLDVIWPKKEGLTLVKWCVPLAGTRAAEGKTLTPFALTAESTSRSSSCMANHSFSSTLMGLTIRPSSSSTAVRPLH